MILLRTGSLGWRRLFVAMIVCLAAMNTMAHGASLHQRLAPAANSAVTVKHDIWNALLKRYVKPDASGINRVDYRAWKASGHARLRTYLRELQGIDVRKLGRAQQFAFWVNLYNAKTIDIVLAHYPVASIRRIDLGGSLFGSGPWRKKVLTVSGQKLSLDDIEHEILRPGWRDKRIHYVVNCASLSCPNLPRTALNGTNNTKILDSAAAVYINHPRGVRVADGQIIASKIYKWYASDFGSRVALIKHWRRYATPRLKKALKTTARISRYHYDWTLNDAR